MIPKADVDLTPKQKTMRGAHLRKSHPECLNKFSWLECRKMKNEEDKEILVCFALVLKYIISVSIS